MLTTDWLIDHPLSTWPTCSTPALVMLCFGHGIWERRRVPFCLLCNQHVLSLGTCLGCLLATPLYRYMVRFRSPGDVSGQAANFSGRRTRKHSLPSSLFALLWVYGFFCLHWPRRDGHRLLPDQKPSKVKRRPCLRHLHTNTVKPPFFTTLHQRVKPQTPTFLARSGEPQPI